MKRSSCYLGSTGMSARVFKSDEIIEERDTEL